MQNQQNQWKSGLIGMGAATGGAVLFYLFLIIIKHTAPFGGFVLISSLMLVAIIAYLLVWWLSAEKHRLLYMILYTVTTVSLGFVTFLLPITLTYAYALQPLGLDALSAFSGSVAILVLVWTPALTLLMRRKKRQHARAHPESEAYEAEFQEALRHWSNGWGRAPQETTKYGRINLVFGIIIGGCFGAGGILLIIFLGSLQSLKGIIYLGVGLLIIGFGLWMFSRLLFHSIKFLHIGRVMGEQQGGVLTAKGTIVTAWMDEQSNTHDGVLLKLRLHDGTNKIFYIKSELFDEMPDEVGEEIELDYLFGSEAVIAVKALSAGASSGEGESQQSEEEQPG